jgi:3-hydroxyisobutyrate dehydrogenase
VIVMADTKKERVGIVGAGRMGLSMLKHLVKHGYAVTVCDISDKQRDAARVAGAAVAATPAEVGKASDIVILGVGYDDEVEDVVFGKNGLLETMAPGSIIAVSSTAKPDNMKALAARVAGKGIAVIDAPICRGRFAADTGTLLALVGGKAEVVERARPVYATFASDVVHLGEIGNGQVGKAINNLMLWFNAVGVLEAGRLAESTGVDMVKLRDALLTSSAASDSLKEWDRVSFTWALKDMQIVADMTDKAGLSLPLTGAIKEVVKEARRVKASNPPNWTGNKPLKYE